MGIRAGMGGIMRTAEKRRRLAPRPRAAVHDASRGVDGAGAIGVEEDPPSPPAYGGATARRSRRPQIPFVNGNSFCYQ